MVVGLAKHFIEKDPLLGHLASFFDERTVLSWPVFPLNTDGIDVAGSNVHIDNIKITNWGETVSVKPANKMFTVARYSCSHGVFVTKV